MEGDFLDGVYWEEWYNEGDTDWTNEKFNPCNGKDAKGTFENDFILDTIESKYYDFQVHVPFH